LERHENRLDESERADKLIIGMLEEMKERHDKDHELVNSRINGIQKKVDANAKFVIGAGAVLATLVALLQVAPPIFKILTEDMKNANIGGVMRPVSEFS